MRTFSTVGLIGLVALAGCFPRDARENSPPLNGDTGRTVDTDTDDTDTDTDTETPDPNDVDDDADGYTENEGDCDVNDKYTYPRAEDICDGVDNDCDDIIDEDGDEDRHEPNDSSPYDLGDLTGVDAEYVEGYIFGSTDQDNFSFWEIDYWDSDFYIEVTLEPPSQLDLSMDLFFIDDENGASAVHVATSASAGAGGTETIVFEGWNTEWSDGTYIVRIWSENQGESCSRPYQMKIDSLAPDWW